MEDTGEHSPLNQLGRAHMGSQRLKWQAHVWSEIGAFSNVIVMELGVLIGLLTV